MLNRATVSLLSLAAFTAIAVGSLQAEEKAGFVSLILSKASAEWLDHDILFRCEVSLDNATGKDLTVRSHFASVFDGLELVVTTVDGKVLRNNIIYSISRHSVKRSGIFL